MRLRDDDEEMTDPLLLSDFCSRASKIRILIYLLKYYP